MESDNMTAYIRENPRLMGVLFTVVLLLTQAGTALAGGNGVTIY